METIFMKTALVACAVTLYYMIAAHKDMSDELTGERFSMK